MQKVETKNRVAKYLDYELEIDKDATPEDVQSNLSEIFPEVSHAKISQDEQGNICFEVIAGTKGI